MIKLDELFSWQDKMSACETIMQRKEVAINFKQKYNLHKVKGADIYRILENQIDIRELAAIFENR